jgi:hypothetical protein
LVGSLPEDLRKDPTVAQLKDFPTAMKSLVDAQKYVGGAVRIPKADAPPEEWQAFHKKLGVPDTPQGYGTDVPTLPEGMEWDQRQADAFRVAAHKLGLTPAQVKGLQEWQVQWMGQEVTTQAQGRRDHQQEVEGQLRQKYGANYERFTALATRALGHLADAETVAYLEQSGLGNHPGLIHAFVQMGQLLAEDRLIPAEVEGTMTPDQAKTQWHAINSDSKHPYWDARNPGHQAAVQEVAKLFQIMAA